MDFFDNPEDEGCKMTKRSISEQCMKHQLYITPEMNDILYLQCQGYTEIANLEPFINLKSLWLDNNALDSISGLDNQTLLTNLYLNNNMISDITGLESLINLKILNLAHNYIRSIQGIDKCPLPTLDLEGNRLKMATDIEQIVLCPSIKALNLANNQIDDQNILTILEKLTKLKFLRLDGNPVIRKIQNYRRTLIIKFPKLRYLDNCPVTEEDRRLAKAFFDGGREAENDERLKIREEKTKLDKDNMKSFRHMQRDALLEKGESLHDHPELMSSDDEDMPKLMAEKYGNIMDDDKEVIESEIFIPSIHYNAEID